MTASFLKGTRGDGHQDELKTSGEDSGGVENQRDRDCLVIAKTLTEPSHMGRYYYAYGVCQSVLLVRGERKKCLVAIVLFWGVGVIMGGMGCVGQRIIFYVRGKREQRWTKGRNREPYVFFWMGGIMLYII